MSIEFKSFELACKSIERDFEQKIVERYMKNKENPDNNQAFHDLLHAKNVRIRMWSFLAVVTYFDPSLISPDEGIAKEYLAMVDLIGDGHDIVRNWRPKKQKRGSYEQTLRERMRGEDEENTIVEMKHELKLLNFYWRADIFKERHLNLVEESVRPTIPGWDNELKTVTQPFLKDDCHIIPRALAIADITGCGIDPKMFIHEGNAEFVETRLHIARAIRQNGFDLPERQMEYFREEMLEWSYDQVKFAKGQKKLIDSKLVPLPEKLQKLLKENVLGEFDNSIELAKQMAERKSQMSTTQLFKVMGYKSFQRNYLHDPAPSSLIPA